MADLAQVPVQAIGRLDDQPVPRHPLLVRVTHWINTLSFFALLISGAAILLAHPRLYWGETGADGSPALIDLPIPLNGYQSGWGRSLHFLAAWIVVLNGMFYGLFGTLSKRFGRDFSTYGPVQRLAYLTVVFLLFPLMIVTGLAMSPAVGAAVPMIVDVLGGHQSARTIHFFLTDLLVLFVIAHIAMVSLTGFKGRMRAMITGHIAPPKDQR